MSGAMCDEMISTKSYQLTRAALGSPAEHDSLGGVNITPPSLTRERLIVTRRGRRRWKGLIEKLLGHSLNFPKRSQVKVRSKVKNAGFHSGGF